ncbi:hypothetical protein Goarm_022992 [Gossypium armourianum]|uniref:Uncharacterized protein n=1 Tax=Gossypium armourianum TaxID=34283 RepID=A0A7J9KEL8_9ROSI|nr:hypothetical protein [Gossypium armourianum]
MESYTRYRIADNFNQAIMFPRKKICLGRWIHQNMKRCISGQKVEVFFPHLVTTLCKKARVPMEDNEKFMKPTKSLIRDSIYTQYVEL